MRNIWIKNGIIVSPAETFKGHIFISGGKIQEIYRHEELQGRNAVEQLYQNTEMYDASECYVLPGLIDLHGDALEKVIQPRKKTIFPVSFSLRAIQAQLLSSGITSMFHGISFAGESGLRSNEKGYEIAKEINSLKESSDALLRHYLHIRYELINHSGLNSIFEMIEKGWVDLLSIMDHTPQYGKYRTLDEYKYYVEKTHNLSGQDLDQYIEKQRAKREAVNPDDESQLIAKVLEHKIPLASHDDDTPDKIKQNYNKGIKISEFPLNSSTAKAVKELGMDAIVGGPNILRGHSHENNLSAREAIKEGWANIICSDYYPFSILAAIFILADEGIPLSQAVKMGSLNPAIAVGLNQNIGSLEEGKVADLLIVSRNNMEHPPVVHRAMVEGKWQFVISYKQAVEKGGIINNLHYFNKM